MSGPGHLLFVSDSLDLGGAERALLGLACALCGEGHRVTVACSRGGGLCAAAEAAGVEVRPLGTDLVKRRVDAAYALRVRQLLHELRPDLVHTHMYASTAATVLARLHREADHMAARHVEVPHVVTEHSEATWRGPAARAFSRWAYGRCDAFIAVSSAIRERLVHADGVPGRRVTVIPNALPVPAHEDLAPLRHRPDDGHQYVGVVARLQWEKGVHVLLRAAELLARTRPRIRFVVVGDGPDRAALGGTAAALRLDDQVIFIGAQPTAAAVIPSFDVLAVPSLSEGTPLVVLEAMAGGTPVVASRVGGIPDQVRHGREALLVAPGDPGELAAGIARLLDDRALSTRLAAAARTRATTQFDPARHLARTLAVYRAALARGAPASRALPVSGGGR
ncbi:hypothetical protein GCM10010145_64990 [Streptomyces ruber]|uniref:Glycosyltransferase n=2 Tax=Streptomyces TaxID=1883 RepID=A0A918BSK7_9ACTN|nr:glycosyltransferase family 4 protein [Streptomyces ruber]GGQ86508.1 hypothetical protein GCM10010145_64990 [Streptomyces ruber]